MTGGTVLLILALVFWFGMASDPPEESATMFVRVFKSVFGVKGYIITIKLFAIIFLLVALFEYYKYFLEKSI